MTAYSFVGCSFLSAAMLAATAISAQALIKISSSPTRNMSCVAGVCTPTAKRATLNVDDLASMLSASDVAVTTIRRNPSIAVTASLIWTAAHRLTLDAKRVVSVDAPIIVGGPGGLTIITDGGGFDGDWAIGRHASITFQDLGGGLQINGHDFLLVSDLASLATAITNNASGYYALADSYDASADGTYASWPVNATFSGTFEGLGHVIDKLKIKSNGLSGIATIRALNTRDAMVRDLGLTNASITSIRGKFTQQGSGMLIGYNFGGTVLHCWTTGKFALQREAQDYVGGLIGLNEGTIWKSWSSAQIQTSRSTVGGLAGLNASFFGFIEQSYFTGSVSGSEAGGIAGYDDGLTTQNYAMGSVSGAQIAGGVSGVFGNDKDNHVLAQSYSTAAITVGSGGQRGGVVGNDVDLWPDEIVSDYWDLDTTGISDPSQGAGNKPNDPGLTGLSDAQLRSGVPDGFYSSDWAQSASINNGYPYLIANPPQ